MNSYKDGIVEELQKLVNFNVNVLDLPELVNYYSGWVVQLQEDNITDPKLKGWLENQAHYWMPKDRKYGQFLMELSKSKN